MLEEALRENTDALKEFTAVLRESNAGREAAVAAIAASAPASKPRAAKATAAEPKAPDYTGEKGFEELKKLAAGYMAVDDAAERDTRKGIFAKAIGKLGAAKLTEVKDGDRGQLAGWLIALTAGEDVAELAEDEPAAEDDMLG